MHVCKVCQNLRWVPLPWERLPDEITWQTQEYYLEHEPEKFYEPCTECNIYGLVGLGATDDTPDRPWTAEALDMAKLNPAFRPEGF